MKASSWKLIFKLLMTLVIGVIVGFVLLLAVFALPVEPMAQNVLASIPAFNGEWAREDSYETLVPGYRGTQLDNSTDSAMLLHAIHENAEPITMRVAEGYRYVADGNAFAALLAYGKSGGADLPANPIARYWHGYLVFLKPLLCFMSYLDIRMLLSIVQALMIAAVTAGLSRRRLGWLIPAFVLSLICITPSAAGYSMQFSTVFCTFLAAMIALLYLPEKCFQGHRLLLFFLIVGMFTSYIDYLTYPLAAFGMPFVLCVFLFPADGFKAEWKRFILCGICWSVGYLGMWAGKWIIAGIFGNEEWFWANLFAKIGERSSDVTTEATLNYAAVLKTVVGVFIKRAYLLVAVAAAAVWMILFAKGKRKSATLCRKRLSTGSVLLASALLPFIWYFFTQNHSYIHAFYTSRNLAVTVFAACAFFSCVLSKNLYKSGKI